MNTSAFIFKQNKKKILKFFWNFNYILSIENIFDFSF